MIVPTGQKILGSMTRLKPPPPKHCPFPNSSVLHLSIPPNPAKEHDRLAQPQPPPWPVLVHPTLGPTPHPTPHPTPPFNVHKPWLAIRSFPYLPPQSGLLPTPPAVQPTAPGHIRRLDSTNRAGGDGGATIRSSTTAIHPPMQFIVSRPSSSPSPNSNARRSG
jgi:hypothetical protein